MKKNIKVAAAIIRDGDQIFATQRGYGNYKDWWEFPGGKIESGEAPEEALVREIKEELAVVVAVDDFLMTVEYDYPEFHLSMDCFWCSITEGQPTLLEHEAARWLPIDNLRQVDWLPADVLVIDEIEQRLHTLAVKAKLSGERVTDNMFIDLVKKNRSFRGYDHSRKISREELVSFVEAARFCPSSINIQPLKYCLVYEEEMVRAVQAQTEWAKGLPELPLPHPGKEPTAFIIICQDTDIDKHLSRFQRDVGIVAQTMLLTAASMDLGGCMIGSFHAGAVREALKLPENIRPLLVVAFGKPDEEVILTDADQGDTHYYRDKEDRHYVPKRLLDDLIIG